MRAQLRAELLKLRSTQATLGLWLGALGLILFVVLLHGFSLASAGISHPANQLKLVFGWAALLAPLFAALLGALSITGEFRHGTIRPTLLVTPQRGRVVAAKVGAGVLYGGALGLTTATAAAIAGVVALSLRGLPVRLHGGDFAVLLTGCTVTAALWAAIGVGVGALVRSQVPVVVGLIAWLLFVENVLLGDVGLVHEVGRFLPGALAKAATGQDTQLASGLAMLLLALYAVVAATAGWAVTAHRDAA
jgi:hypothetical protein